MSDPKLSERDRTGSMRYHVLLYFLRPYKYIYGGILVVMLCAAVLESLSLAAFFPVFSSTLGESGQEGGGVLGLIAGGIKLLPFSDPIVAASIFLIGVYTLKAMVVILREGLVAHTSGRILCDVKNRMMESYAGADYHYFLTSKQGALIYNTLSAPHRVALLLLRIPQTAAEVLRILAITFVLFFISPLGALSLILLGVGYYSAVHYLSARVSYHLGKGRVTAGAKMTVLVNEFLTGIRHIFTFRATKDWLDRFRRENQTFSHLYARDLLWNAIPKSLIDFSAVTLFLGIVLLLRYLTPDSFTATLPGLGVFGVALVQLLPAIIAIGRMRMELFGSLPDAELVYDSLTSPMPRRKDGTKVLKSFEKAIIFEDISFAYPERGILLNGVTLTFEKGKVTAILGSSGAGKTTLINLILGLFEPTGGRITIDGVSLQEYKLETWLNKIGFVSQDPFIYHSSVAENILFERNSHSRESVIKAATIANAHGFICELPEGYDTIVGDRGMKLSGGQQQRIGIARAILDDPQLLILDEATSSLDSMSENLVQEAIDKVSIDRTVLIIAHRLSTIRYADKIIVLDEGRVVEEGSHRELIEQQGHYSRLVTSSRDWTG